MPYPKELLLGAGHNASWRGHPLTPGKRGPLFCEGDFNRDICARVERYDPRSITFLNPGIIGKKLGTRRTDVNRLHKLESSFFVSVHANASGNTVEWRKATGTTVFVHPRASQTSKDFAALLLEETHKLTGLENRGMKKAWLAMTGVKPPCVLWETLFMDNEEDVQVPRGLVADALWNTWSEFRGW